MSIPSLSTTTRVAAARTARPTGSHIAFWAAGYLVLVAIAGALAVSGLVDFRVVLTALNLVAFAGAVLGLRDPPLGLLGVTMLCTLDSLVAPLLLKGGLWRWNTLNYWLLAVMFLWSPFLLFRVSDISSRLLQALLLVLGIEVMLSTDVLRGVQDCLEVVTSFGLLIYLVRAGVKRETWFWVALVNGVLATCASAGFLAQFAQLPYVNPNNWSHVPLTAMLVICLGFPLIEQNPRQQAILGVLAIINAAWVFLSTSRGSLLVAIVALAFLVLLAPNIRRSALYVAIGGLICLALFSQFSTFETTTVQRVQLLFDRSQSARNRTSGRFDLAVGGWYIFKEHPLGVGTGGFAQAWAGLDRREGLSQFHRGQATPAHSGWVKVLSENGLPGVVLLIAYVLSFSFVGWRTGDRRLRLLGFLVTSVLTLALIPVELSHKDLLLLAQGVAMFCYRGIGEYRRRPEG